MNLLRGRPSTKELAGPAFFCRDVEIKDGARLCFFCGVVHFVPGFVFSQDCDAS